MCGNLDQGLTVGELQHRESSSDREDKDVEKTTARFAAIPRPAIRGFNRLAPSRPPRTSVNQSRTSQMSEFLEY